MAKYEKNLSDDEFGRLYSPSYFDRFSGNDGYPRSAFVHPPRKWEERRRTLLDLAALSGEELVLEAGSAAGSLSMLLAPHAKQVIGVDLSEVAIDRARERAAREHVSNVEFVKGSIDDLSRFRDENFDRVVGFDIIEHVFDPVLRGFIEEAHRVLKPGGFLCLFTPNLNHYVERLKQGNVILQQTPEHIAVRNWGMIEAQLRATRTDFVIDKLYYNTAPYPVIRHVESVLKHVPLLKELVRWRICARLRKP